MVSIEEMRKAQMMTRDIAMDFRLGFAHVHRQNLEALVLIALIQSFESAPLPLAPPSPGGPEIEQ